MPISTGDAFIAALIFLLGRRARASTPEKAAEVLKSITTLQQRANQAPALAWIPDLEAAGASPGEARALARWIGLESSGNPTARSKLGERGLLQIMEKTAKEALTPGEWLQLGDPTTSRAEHARIALKQARWHRDRAKKWVKPWPGDDTFDSMFYAKMHHAYPKDLSDAKSGGPAATFAREMTARWKKNPNQLHRLAAASVVGWGSVLPP